MSQSVAAQVAEIWVLYIIGMIMIAARIYCRTKQVGYRNYQLDDYLVIGVAGMWTMAPAIGQVFVQVAKGRHTSDLTPEQRESMSEEERGEWTYGSQMFLFGLTGYFFILWTLKFNMLCFYSRVVRGLWTEKFVRPLMGFVLLSAVAIIFTLALTCRPFKKLWQVWPDPGPNCVPQNMVFFVVILTFNLLTDVCIMLVPIPVLRGIQIARFKKYGLYLLFTLGFFCMFAAILRFVLVFRMNQSGVSAMWSMREDCVGIFVGQAPMITPMFKRRFWLETRYNTSKSGGSHIRSRDLYKRRADESHELRDGTGMRSGGRVHDPYSMTTLGIGSDSQEAVVPKDVGSDGEHGSGKGVEDDHRGHGGIQVQQHRTVDVESLGEGYSSPTDPRW